MLRKSLKLAPVVVGAGITYAYVRSNGTPVLPAEEIKQLAGVIFRRPELDELRNSRFQESKKRDAENKPKTPKP